MARQKTGAKKSWKYLQLSREIKTIYINMFHNYWVFFIFFPHKQRASTYVHTLYIYVFHWVICHHSQKFLRKKN